MKLNQFLRKERARRNLSQKSAAKLIGVSQTTYSFLENGSNPSYKTYEKLARFFGMTPEEMRRYR